MPEKPRARRDLPIPALTWLTALALLLSANASHAVVLGEATSITSLMCVSVPESTPPIAAPVDYSCDRLWFAPVEQSGPSRAFASTGFGDPLEVSVHVETTGAPHQVSTNASARIKSQLAVAQIATPPVSVNTVPVSLSTEGSVGVAPIAGLLAGGGTYVSSIESTVFTNGDVFEHTMRTTSPFVEIDDYDIVETLYLTPDHVYFVNLYTGCNFAVMGTSGCEGHATASFHLDQAAFDEQRGENSFDLAQYFAVQRSPNLVPEPAAALLGVTVLGALVGCARVRGERERVQSRGINSRNP